STLSYSYNAARSPSTRRTRRRAVSHSPRCLFSYPPSLSFFFFNDTATPEIYTLSLHDALPISRRRAVTTGAAPPGLLHAWRYPRSEEHTSELQSLTNLVCRLLLEKKKKRKNRHMQYCKRHAGRQLRPRRTVWGVIRDRHETRLH